MASIITNQNLLVQQRNLLCRLVFGCIFVLLIYDFLSYASLQQFRSPALIFPYVDLTYILFNLSGAGDFIVSNFFLSSCFTILLFIFCILSFIWPFKRVFIILFLIFYFFYFLCYNSYGAHHVHSKIGILFIPVPFLFSDKDFIFVWQALRYYTLYLYADSFLWKIFRGTWTYKKQGILIIKENLTPLLYSHPDYKLSGIYQFLFLHPIYGDILLKLVLCLKVFSSLVFLQRDMINISLSYLCYLPLVFYL